jgi:hypothetical protein
VDPYAVLALLGFLVFLFYIIYNFLNRTGNGKRTFTAASWAFSPPRNYSALAADEGRHFESDSPMVFRALERFSDFNWENFFTEPPSVVAALSPPVKDHPAAF